MLNTVFKAWVKYVNNQRIVVGITNTHTSTEKLISLQTHLTYCVQIRFNSFTFLRFNHTISTYKNSIYNLLNKSFTHNPQYLLLEPLNEI